MEQYLRKTELSSRLNSLGLHLLLLVCGVGWFVWLWGVSMPALLAGLALGLLLQTAMRKLRSRAADDREEAARRRLGGEMALERLLFMTPTQVHQQTAQLLRLRYPLQIRSSGEQGTLCLMNRELLLIRCSAVPDNCEAGVMEAVQLMRACQALHADRGVLCVTGRISKQLSAYSETCPLPVRVVTRETLLELAGHAFPATDEQLVALKQRRQRRGAMTSFTSMLLHPSKARRYMGYGMGLMLMYILTGLWYYPIPGAVCMGLAVLSRCSSQSPDLL